MDDSQSPPFAFELHGFRDCLLNGIYRVQEEQWNTRSGSNLYQTYWKLESARPYFMYWQENKGRHAITPQFDAARPDLLHGNLFPQVQQGVEEPGLAFYRPLPNNEWLEYDLASRRWFSHPQGRNIYYAPLTQLELMQRLQQMQPGSVQPAVASSYNLSSLSRSASSYNPPSPRCVPAACTPSAAAMPGTPHAMLPTLRAPSTPVASFATPGTPQHPFGAAPGSPAAAFGAAPGTPISARFIKSASVEVVRQRRRRSLLSDERTQDSKRRKQKQRVRSRKHECVICQEEMEKLWMCVPCGHVCLCEPCAKSLEGKTCPICRSVVEKVNITHMSAAQS